MQSNDKGAQKRLAGSMKGLSLYIFTTVGGPFKMSAIHRQNTQN